MISLDIQIKLIIFSFMFGFMFSFLIEWLNNKIKKCKVYKKIIVSTILVIIMTFVYFIGIQKIGNAIFHVYSVISVLIGFILHDIVLKLIANKHKK